LACLVIPDLLGEGLGDVPQEHDRRARHPPPDVQASRISRAMLPIRGTGRGYAVMSAARMATDARAIMSLYDRLWSCDGSVPAAARRIAGGGERAGQRWLRNSQRPYRRFRQPNGMCYWPPSCTCPARGQVSCPARAWRNGSTTPGARADAGLRPGQLIDHGHKVTRIYRSPRNAERVRALGAEPIALDQQPAGVWRRIVGGS
jgi:hypothetical protein